MFDHESLLQTRQVLQELADIVRYTQQALADLLAKDQATDIEQKVAGKQFARTLDHLGQVREGFILSQRVSKQTSRAELQSLVAHVLTDWSWVYDLGFTLQPSEHIEQVDQQLIVYHHALIALGTLPHLPAQVITFPQPRPTYRDVIAPTLPGELLARIEELERLISQVELHPIDTLAYGPLRRTYAFFEASNWLISNHLDPILGYSGKGL